MYQFRVDVKQGVRIKAELLLPGCKQVAHKYVGFGYQLAHQLGTLRFVQGHGNRLLAAVVDIELKVIAL